MSVSLKVKIFDSKGTQLLQVAKSTLTIGSASHCDVVLNHPSVNAEHTRAWLEGGRIWVQDLGSPSGTALNEIRLPALKPMLVRDLDMLRLGECEATLGLEPVVVRVPVVKPKVISPPTAASVQPVPEAKGPSHLEIEKRREELEALGRELADLRLHMQMTKLEKNSTQEMAQQLQNLREEIKTVQEQKAKWSETLRQMEAEKLVLRKGIETELAEFKTDTLKELHAQRAKDHSELEGWKRESVTQLMKAVNAMSAAKVKSWTTRPLSQDMIFEWESDLNHTFRRVLLGETEPASPYASTAAPAAHAPPPAPMPVPSHTQSSISKRSPAFDLSNAETVVAFREPTKSMPVVPEKAEHTERTGRTEKAEKTSHTSARRRKLPRPQFALPAKWKPLAITSAVLVAVMMVLWMGTAYIKQRGARSLSSQTAPEPARSAAPEHRGPAHYEPKQSRKYRASYTDNVLYLESYVAAEQNPEFRKRWLTELGKIASTEWKLDQWSLAPLAAKEQALIQDLSRIKDSINPERELEGINQMRAREAQFQKDLDAILKNRAFIDRFLKFKRAFYVRNQVYLSKEAN